VTKPVDSIERRLQLGLENMVRKYGVRRTGGHWENRVWIPDVFIPRVPDDLERGRNPAFDPSSRSGKLASQKIITRK